MWEKQIQKSYRDITNEVSDCDTLCCLHCNYQEQSNMFNDNINGHIIWEESNHILKNLLSGYTLL